MAGLLFAAALPAQMPATSVASVELKPGELVSVEIPARDKRFLTFSLCSGCFGEVQIEQLQWMVSAYWTGPGVSDRLAYATDAGLHSIIHLPIVASDASTYQLEVDAAAPSAAAVRVSLSVPRPATPEDQERASASQALARAERLRRSKEGDTASKALAAYDQAITAARTVQDARLQLQALLGKARVYLYRTGDYKAGLAASTEAIAITKGWSAEGESREDTALRAFAWKVLSSAYSFLAQYPEMIDATNHSLALYETLGDLYWQGILEGNEANVYLETGDMQHALSSAENALAIARALSDKPGIAFTQATLATIHQQRGEYQAAFDADQAALDTMQQVPDPDEEGQVWMNLAELYDELNDPEREREALQQSLPLLRSAQDTANESSALGDLGLLDLREHKLTEAEESLRHAMRIAASHDLGREQALAFLGQAQLLAARQRTPEALTAVHSGQALAEKTGEVATSALLLQEEGDVDAHRGDDADALAAYRRAESIWSAIPNLEHTALARASMARLELRSGAPREAHNDILLALAGFEASRRNVGGRSLRESFFASVHDFYDLAIDTDMRDPSQTSSVEEALIIAERARARSLMDAVRASSTFSTRDVPGGLIDQSATIEKRISATEQTISRLRLSGDETPALEQATAQLHALVLQADEVEARERKTSSPSLFEASTHSPTLDGIRTKLLKPDSVLLEYWTGRRNIYLWIVTAGSLRSFRLCSASALDASVRSYRQALLAREDFPANEDWAARQTRIALADRELDQRASVLGHLLFPALLPSTIHRLIVVPDGVLSSVPFAALRIGSAGYVIQRYELVEEPSASVAMELLTRPTPARAGDRIAVFADPVYNRFDPRLGSHGGATVVRAASTGLSGPQVLRSDSGLDVSQLPRLSGSLREAHAITAIAGSDRVSTWLGFQANPKQVMQIDWRNFAIAHFATHTNIDAVHPELSGIVLSTLDPQGEHQDGILWLHDIYRTPMPVSLVVLSGCSTASGKSIPGEGISGLAQAFLSSGTSGVIGSLWSVDDTAAGEMIPWFYRALLNDRLGISGALRAAQLRMLSRHEPPYDWAGYIVEGDWRAGTDP